MADPDYTLAAHPYMPPAIDPLKTATGIEQYRLLQKENQIKGYDAAQRGIDFEKLGNYGQTGNNDDLRGATPEMRVQAVQGERGEEENKKDQMTRRAARIYGETDPKIKQYLWDRTREEWQKKGWVHPEESKKYPTPNDGILENIIRGGTGVKEYRETTGQEAGAQAGGRAPYEGREVDPTKPYMYPATRPGGPLGNGGPPQTALQRPGAPTSVGEPSGAGPAPPGTKNMTDTNATVLQPGQAPQGTPAAKGPPGTRNAAPVDKTNPYDAEVPEVKVGQDLPTGKGVVNQGIDPLRQAARAEGLKKFNEEIEPGAASAAKTRASLGTMKAGLDKGVTTDRLAELKTSVGGFLYGMTKDAGFVKRATGLDVSNQEVFNKESTRMGLTFARQTEGAREAVQAIRIALGANPSLLNTEEGNRKIIGIMDQASKYDQERSKAAQAYMKKNDGHLTGFDTWFSTRHSPASFISKEVPYAVPQGGKSEMQDGVTYEFNFGGKMVKGTYNAETGHMDPVKQ